MADSRSSPRRHDGLANVRSSSAAAILQQGKWQLDLLGHFAAAGVATLVEELGEPSISPVNFASRHETGSAGKNHVAAARSRTAPGRRARVLIPIADGCGNGAGAVSRTARVSVEMRPNNWIKFILTILPNGPAAKRSAVRCARYEFWAWRSLRGDLPLRGRNGRRLRRATAAGHAQAYCQLVGPIWVFSGAGDRGRKEENALRRRRRQVAKQWRVAGRSLLPRFPAVGVVCMGNLVRRLPTSNLNGRDFDRFSGDGRSRRLPAEK